MLRELERALSPALDLTAELLVRRVVEVELLPSESPEAAEHVREDGGVEPAVLLGCERAKPFEAVEVLDREQVDEVASLRSAEEGE